MGSLDVFSGAWSYYNTVNFLKKCSYFIEKEYHFKEIFITGYTACCQTNNLQCTQR